MKQGDATWTKSKVILGWLILITAKTIKLPPHLIKHLLKILISIVPDQKAIATKDWHKVLGELRSMSIALPGSVDLFLLLQEALRHKESMWSRLSLSKLLHGFLKDLRWLAKDVATQPTRIAELIPDPVPVTTGACDAAGTGMGGYTLRPLSWRLHHITPLATAVSSIDSAPIGVHFQSWRHYHNSALEFVGLVAYENILAMAAKVGEQTIYHAYDNTAAVFWQRKGAATTMDPPVYLLRLQALNQWQSHYVPKHNYIPDQLNVMADFLSRA